ncbi:hypothetical protein A2U01_0081296, partial [Trifolium medium]|nr:hypothetical protein [Trifolium medium]
MKDTFTERFIDVESDGGTAGRDRENSG